MFRLGRYRLGPLLGRGGQGSVYEAYDDELGRQEQTLMLRALRRLPLDLQIALGMHYFHGLKVAEIAVATGAPVGTIKYRLSHGRERLREHIEELASSPMLARSTLVSLDGWLAELT